MPSVRTTKIPASQIAGDPIPGDVSTSEAGVLPDAGGDLPGRTPVGYEVPAGQRATTPSPPQMMSTDEANQYRQSLRKPSSSDMSTKEADQYLKQYRAQQGNSKVAPNQTAGGSAVPPITGDQAAAAPEDFFHAAYHSLPDIVQKHPILAGIGTAAALPLIGAALPEGAAMAVGGWGLRTLVNPAIKAAAAGAGLDWLTGGKLHETLGPKLIDMISHLGEE